MATIRHSGGILKNYGGKLDFLVSEENAAREFPLELEDDSYQKRKHPDART